MQQVEPTIQESIMAVYESLPPGERKLADTALARLSNLASYSATELAAEASVSKATAARFFRRIGYESFEQARRQARAEAHLASPLYALAGVNPKERPSDALSRHLAADLKNLSESFRPLGQRRPRAGHPAHRAGAAGPCRGHAQRPFRRDVCRLPPGPGQGRSAFRCPMRR